MSDPITTPDVLSVADQAPLPTDEAVPGVPGPGGVLKTKLNKRWLIKMLVFFAAMVILGVWGTIDAFWVYPARGYEAAEYQEMKYLTALEKAGGLSSASIKDPAQSLATLENSKPTSDVEQTKMLWLDSLSRVVSLEKIEDEIAAGRTPAYSTVIADPRARLDELTQKWQSLSTPTALSRFDIPVQYLFMVIGLAAAAYIAFFLLKCRGTVFTYHPVERRLTLPGGRTLVPTDIEDVDRRLWHKFFVELKLKGDEVPLKLDLLRYWPLEAWFLDMEKRWPGYVPPAEETAVEVPAEAVSETPST